MISFERFCSLEPGRKQWRREGDFAGQEYGT